MKNDPTVQEIDMQETQQKKPPALIGYFTSPVHTRVVTELGLHISLRRWPKVTFCGILIISVSTEVNL